MSLKLVLVLGGASSGKSAFAEKIITDSALAKIYIATARIWDAEIKRKVATHKLERGTGWQTHEAPLEPGDVIKVCGKKHALLLDCATMWLTNHMMDDSDLDAAERRLLDALGASDALHVVVSNDVSGGITPDNALARQFQRAQGALNQRLAARADVVVHVTAGLPTVLKGAL